MFGRFRANSAFEFPDEAPLRRWDAQPRRGLRSVSKVTNDEGIQLTWDSTDPLALEAGGIYCIRVVGEVTDLDGAEANACRDLFHTVVRAPSALL